MLRFIQRRRIKKVIKLMSTRLIVGYGSREYFSVGQVKTSTGELSACQQKIALALYANPQDLDLENQPELQAIRSDVAHDFFAGGRLYRSRCASFIRCWWLERWSNGRWNVSSFWYAQSLLKMRINFINSINIFAVKD